LFFQAVEAFNKSIDSGGEAMAATSGVLTALADTHCRLGHVDKAVKAYERRALFSPAQLKT